MGEYSEAQRGVPESICQKTIATLPLEEPFVIQLLQYESLKGVLCVDGGWPSRLMIDSR